MTTVVLLGVRIWSVDSGDVACKEDAYRDAAGTIIQACDESPGLCDHNLSVKMMKYAGGEE